MRRDILHCSSCSAVIRKTGQDVPKRDCFFILREMKYPTLGVAFHSMKDKNKKQIVMEALEKIMKQISWNLRIVSIGMCHVFIPWKWSKTSDWSNLALQHPTTENLMLHDLIIWFLQQFSSHESWLGDNPYHVSKIADCYAIFNNAKNKAPPVQRSKTCPWWCLFFWFKLNTQWRATIFCFSIWLFLTS